MMQRAHRGARRSLLTPALLALLLGTLGLFSAAPAQAQLRATLSGLSLSAGGSTVTLDGCFNAQGNPDYTKPCAATVPRNVLAVTVTPTWDGTPNTATVSSREMASGKELTAPQSVTSGNSVTVALASGLAYNSAGTEHRTLVAIQLERTAGLPVYYGITIYKGGPTSVSLSISPNQVTETDNEAAKATVTATLSWPWDGDADVVIPLTGTHGTSEAGDWVFENANVMIRRGQSTGTTRIFVWPDADTDDETMTVGLGTLPTGARSSRARNTTLTAGTPSSATLTITDDDDGSGLSGSSGTATLMERCASHLPSNAVSVAEVRGWRDAHSHDAAHVLRWNRVLAALGDDVGAGISPMTVAESRANESRFMRSRWARVTATLEAIESCLDDSGTLMERCASYLPSNAVSVAEVRGWRDAHSHDAAHVLRWNRVLAALGDDVGEGISPMTVAESRANESRFMRSRWARVTATLEAIETCLANQAGGDRAPGKVVGIEEARALAIVGELSPDDAADALLARSGLEEKRLEALDRLGNANGRYDVGDLLAWIERCRTGGARCDGSPKTSPSAAALPAAIAAGAVPRRPRRRAPRGRVRRRRRTGMLTVLCAATLWSCDAAGGPTAAVPPEPGLLTVEWTAPARGPVAAGALVEIDGPHVGDARVAGGLELYATEGTGPKQFVLAGTMRNGAVLEFEVPDKRQAGLYSVRVVEVAGDDHRLLDADRYRAGIASN